MGWECHCGAFNTGRNDCRRCAAVKHNGCPCICDERPDHIAACSVCRLFPDDPRHVRARECNQKESTR